tara:strand:- start:764 stop:1963 length:1200 start_codon:yes stop_codon:yes gene_type:complete
MSSEWGKGAANNTIGYGQAAGNATNGYGKSQKVSYAGVTDIVGLIALSISYSANNYCDDSGNTPAPTVSNNTGSGTFASTAGLIINTNTGVINTDTSTAGSYVVTYTDTDAATATFSLAINDLDNAAFSYSASSFEPTDANPTPTITGLTGGTFSGTTGLVINSTTGEIDLSASTEASHTVTYNTSTSGSSVCPNTSTQTVEIAVAGIANNYSMSFDGLNDQINTSTNLGISGASSRTFSAWIKTTDAGGGFDVIVATGNTSNTGNNFELDFRNNVIMWERWGLGVFGSVTVNDGDWHHACITYDGNILKLYVDGSEDTGGDFPYTIGVTTSTDTPVRIGGMNHSLKYFNGLIDEVAIWNTALTAPQIAQIYNATSTGKTADLSTISGSNLKYWNRMGD